MILSFGGKTPRDEGAVFVAANATVLGDVTLGKGTNIWYGAVLRGDEGTLVLGENCNVQDNAVLHCDPGGQVLLGKNVTVGHCALAHGCTVGENSLIGMHATMLNHSVVGKNCLPGSSRPSGTTSWPTTSKTLRPMWRWGGSTRPLSPMLKIEHPSPKNFTGRLTNLSQERHDFGPQFGYTIAHKGAGPQPHPCT